MSARPRSPRLPPSSGVTLVELFVAMGLTAIIALMLLAAAMVQTTVQRQEERTQQLNDGVRASLEELVTSARLAGKTFQSRVASNAVGAQVPQLLSAINVINGGTTGPDALQLIIPDDSLAASLMQKSDQFTNPLLVDAPAAALKAGDLFLLNNGTFQRAVLYQLTINPIASTIAGKDLVGNPINLPIVLLQTTPPATGAGTFYPGAVVTRVRLVAYQVTTAVIPSTPVLALQDGAPLSMAAPLQIVAENIEDVQIAIGVDGLATGVVDGRLSEIGRATNDDEWVYNYPGEAVPVNLLPGTSINAIRITVISRTALPDSTLGAGRPAAEDRPAGAPDGYRRRVLTTTVAVRSMATS